MSWLLKRILAKDLALFGDNAYLNSLHRATLYPNTSGGPKDNYNFYHSQLHIRIECAFGMLDKGGVSYKWRCQKV